MKSRVVPHPSWIEVDLGQFRKNIGVVRGRIGEALYCLPVKANAYGHGLKEIGRAAEEAGVDYLGVAHLQEGIELRDAGVKIPILVLGAIHEDQIDDLIANELEFSISSKMKADFVAKRCEGKCRVHLEVDTGMHRTGVRSSTAIELMRHLRDLKVFDVVGIYSHFATAGDAFATRQMETFQALLMEPIFKEQPLIRHIANSSGITHFPPLDMVRPSLITFGYGALEGVAPCFALKSKVSYFKIVEKGEGISYGHTYVTTKRTRIVTVPIGYGDGYRRQLSNRGHVLIRGKKFPITGTICMDQFMVDVGDDDIFVGDEVVLIGKQRSEEILLTDIAELCDTIPYEILCQFNNRVPRIYI